MVLYVRSLLSLKMYMFSLLGGVHPYLHGAIHFTGNGRLFQLDAFRKRMTKCGYPGRDAIPLTRTETY
jgi:hypothetical protein